jgi:hypothetical protein
MNDVAKFIQAIPIDLVRQRYHTLRDEIADSVRSLFHPSSGV